LHDIIVAQPAHARQLPARFLLSGARRPAPVAKEKTAAARRRLSRNRKA